MHWAIDEDGNLVDSLLREKQDMESAQVFFEQALEVAQTPPNRVETDRWHPIPGPSQRFWVKQLSMNQGIVWTIRLNQIIAGSSIIII